MKHVTRLRLAGEVCRPVLWNVTDFDEQISADLTDITYRIRRRFEREAKKTVQQSGLDSKLVTVCIRYTAPKMISCLGISHDNQQPPCSTDLLTSATML